MYNTTHKIQEPIYQILITDIFCDDTWNVRRNNWQKDEDFQFLVDSIRVYGKIFSPIKVRLMPKSEGRLELYFIVTGFRRYHAAVINGFKTVPCIIKKFTEAEARLCNIQDNCKLFY